MTCINSMWPYEQQFMMCETVEVIRGAATYTVDLLLQSLMAAMAKENRTDLRKDLYQAEANSFELELNVLSNLGIADHHPSWGPRGRWAPTRWTMAHIENACTWGIEERQPHRDPMRAVWQQLEEAALLLTPLSVSAIGQRGRKRGPQAHLDFSYRYAETVVRIYPPCVRALSSLQAGVRDGLIVRLTCADGVNPSGYYPTPLAVFDNMPERLLRPAEVGLFQQLEYLGLVECIEDDEQDALWRTTGEGEQTGLRSRTGSGLHAACDLVKMDFEEFREEVLSTAVG